MPWEPILIVLLDSQDEEAVSLVLDHGADDVVHPPHSISAIMLRRQVALGARWRPTSATYGGRREPLRLGRLEMDERTFEIIDGRKSFSLSRREFELLARLNLARGQVVSRADLLEDIWGVQQGSEAVLDATVHRLRKRLDKELEETDLVSTVRGVGYRLDPSFLDPPHSVGS